MLLSPSPGDRKEHPSTRGDFPLGNLLGSDSSGSGPADLGTDVIFCLGPGLWKETEGTVVHCLT